MCDLLAHYFNATGFDDGPSPGDTRLGFEWALSSFWVSYSSRTTQGRIGFVRFSESFSLRAKDAHNNAYAKVTMRLVDMKQRLRTQKLMPETSRNRKVVARLGERWIGADGVEGRLHKARPGVHMGLAFEIAVNDRT